ncbi:DUF2617 family protein [Mycolicibacterium monacense]|uniref:DUF2617 domain-containing protein n=3 Tax=Mycobacteriaceae TaxID=1762 RepID=A0AAD1IXJ2_MYCMB|nr:DUF2617 family protein [Mycolicibacterium monacense]MDA4100718.1 hypothetical protein [Mycolicibacterium monacense DSM 44395]ORB14884.1 hypothetical protein BST34_22460 [Mycolicibacterium monacense DSM 44395]QHP85596.1 DUF2617 family protein [Mycolicibacterium monacense DSM 44395]BBZ61502.1 hypothetical protein MMON_28030 [Mycolicibacterium monacense]
MPFHQLAVAPADVDGAALGLALNAPAPVPLAGIRLSHRRGGALVLGVLGASHVVTIEHPAGGFSEEVSCSAHAYGRTLPGRFEGPGYRFESETTVCAATEFETLAQRLHERCLTDRNSLGGRFPGDDAALTVLQARPDGPGWWWQTWHLYPGGPRVPGGTAVHTTSRWHP